jgi:hypothetical protein
MIGEDGEVRPPPSPGASTIWGKRDGAGPMDATQPLSNGLQIAFRSRASSQQVSGNVTVTSILAYSPGARG